MPGSELELAAEAVLGPGGALARVLPRYEARPGQLALARAVARALEGRTRLLAEAGTGTGKTLAYLAPALLSGRKVVVSTATKTLQEQILNKDLPLLARAGLSFNAAAMKGRANYLCLARFERFEAEPRFESPHDAKHWPRLSSWAHQSEVGDRAELELPEHYGPWRELNASAESCTGSRCADFDRCFVTRMRREALEADLVVVNHHLFFADLALRTRAGMQEGMEVIPRYDAVIFDEAHALEEVAGQHFGVAASSLRTEELCRDGERILLPGHPAWAGCASLWPELRRRAGALFLAVGQGPMGEAVALGGPALEGARAALPAVLEVLSALENELGGADEGESSALGRRVADLSRDLRFLLGEQSRRHVYYAERRGRGVFLRASPVDVAAELGARLHAQVDTAIYTSATLTAGGAFDYPARRLGLLEARPETLSVPSPFDWADQAVLYVPGHLPEPSAPAFLEAAADEVERLCELTGGRAFVLCTSLRAMGELHRLLRFRLNWPALLQGELPKAKLLERFMAEPSVLFGSASFWEGVDVPGEALSLVIIDKLPFASPKDPVVQARVALLESRGEEPFGAYQLPEAALSLRQGFGRLIRTASDRGIVAILDRRLRTRGYGRAFLEALPEAPRVGEFEELESAWRRLVRLSGSGPRPRRR